MQHHFNSILLGLCLSAATTASAQTGEASFNENFCDSTLRLDYIFSGNATTQRISLDKLNLAPRWYGKHKRLAQLPVEGNGQVTVRKHGTKEVIYRNSFSTLFQEWQSYDEAKHVDKAFENVFLIPMPKDTVDVTIDLRNNRKEITGTMTHTIAPNDILIRRIGFNNRTPYTTLQAAADTNNCINIAFVAEGYRKEESASVDSGTSEPSKDLWRNTVLGSHFDTFYSDRYLTTLNLKALHDVLAGIPYEHIIVLVNTSEYGGGGILNSYNLSMTHHPQYRQVVVHEFGHSFAGLADEYAYEQEQVPMYPHDVEPWEKNITTLVDFHDKWESLIKPGTPVPTPLPETTATKGSKKAKGKKANAAEKSDMEKLGVYEGAGYSLKGVYRPCPDCRMRSNNHKEFCPACQKALKDLINFYTK